jgi:hypothetical protein
LTSKIEGTYEFEVLSLREYFAASFLYRFAGEETQGFDRIEVLRELLRRPYWLNTARFYGGNAEVSDLSVLADGIVDELRDNPPPHAVIAGWTLLTDGVFTNRPRYARDVLESLCADEHLQVLVNALNRGEISPLPAVPAPVGSGEDPTWIRLTALLAADPAHSATQLRVQVLRELLNRKREFATWWTGHVVGALTNPAAVDAWLEMAATCEAAAGHTMTSPVSTCPGRWWLSGSWTPGSSRRRAGSSRASFSKRCTTGCVPTSPRRAHCQRRWPSLSLPRTT